MHAAHYRELEIWKESMDLCEEIYKLTEAFPRKEQFGITAQMRRASISIPSNIAEGFVRKHPKEFKHFLSISISSLAELDTQIALCHRFGYLETSKLPSLIERTDRLGRKMTRMYQRTRGD